MRRTDQPTTLCDRQEWCDGATDWFIWDGDQILWEKHGGLEVGYVHALGIDAPVELIREGEALFTAINWRGLMSQLVDTAGEPVGCTGSNPPPCEDIAFAAGRAGPYLGGDPRKTPEWYGSIVTAQQDASGLMYRRNRYYDPEAGQFTQQDPIGIAGGLNLYGYANGDPINFSDPFGLFAVACPICERQADISFQAGRAGGSELLGVAVVGVLAAAGGAVLGRVVGHLVSSALGAALKDGDGPADSDPARGLRHQLADHERRLEQYRANPDAFDNRDFLKNAPSEEIRERIINGRIRNLEHQIETFREAIRRMEGGR
jgi:RHS repeat-associated protein